MFDVSQIQKRYFEIRLTVETEDGQTEDGQTNTVELQVEPPTVKQLERLTSVAKADASEVLEELRDAVGSILSKNKARYRVPDAYIENLDFDQLSGILTAYMQWVAEEKQAKN
jgi:thymidylate synthase ThyX